LKKKKQKTFVQLSERIVRGMVHPVLN